MTSGSITVMLIFVCSGKCKIQLSVPCHSNLNVLVFRPVRALLKIWSIAGIVFGVIGVRFLQKKEREEMRDGEKRELWLIFFAG